MAGRVMLETERLLLREFDEDDLEAFFLLCSVPEVVRYTGFSLDNIEQARENLRTRPMADYLKHGYGRWACVLKEDGTVMGFAGLKYLDELNEVDLGYRFLPEYWGRGLATEAARPVVDYGFRELQLDSILGLVDPANKASVRVLEKTGFQYDSFMSYWGSEVAKYVARPNRLLHNPV